MLTGAHKPFSKPSYRQQLFSYTAACIRLKEDWWIHSLSWAHSSGKQWSSPRCCWRKMQSKPSVTRRSILFSNNIFKIYISNSFQSKVKDTENGNESSTHAQKPTFTYLKRILRQWFIINTTSVKIFSPDWWRVYSTVSENQGWFWFIL